MEKIKRVISVFISVLVFIGIVNPTVINAAIIFKDTHFYEIDNTILWSADGSTDITEYDSNLKATVIKVGSKVVLDSREEPFETYYIADNKRDYGSDNIVLDEGKTGLFERYYLKEKGQQKERQIAANFSTSGASKRGDQVGAYVKVTNLTNYPMYDVHVHAFPKEFLSYVSADMPGTPDPDSGGAWFFFEKIDPKDTAVVNVIYSLTSDCDSQQYSAGAAVGNSKARPAFIEPTTGWIAMNTKEGVTRQKQDAVISVGTKPKTETITIPHKKLEPKAGFEIIPGKDGSKDVVTTYTVDKQTGKVTPKVEEKNYVAPVDETYKEINYTYEGDPEMDYGKERKDEAKRIIYKGIKPKTEHVVIPHKKLEPKAGFEIIPGKDGSKDVVTTYTVDKQTGKVTPKVEEKNYVAPVDETYKEINYTYEGDPEMDYGKERKDDTKRIIYKGIKPKTEHVVIPHKKLEPKAGFEIIPGKDGSKDIVTTYTVDKQTGKVTPKVEEKNYVAPVDETYKEINYTYEGDPEMDYGKERKDEAKRIIYKGIKPKTEHVVIPHKKLEPKAGFEIIPGKDGSKDVVTTYTVDKQTGKVTPKVEEKNYVAPVDETYKEINYTYEGDPEMDYGKERKDDTKRIIYKGIKPKTEHVVIPHKKLEPKAGFEIIPGKDGSKDVVTTYTVDKQTGKVTPKTEEKNLVKPVDEQYRAKQTERPTERVKLTHKTATEAKPSLGKTVMNNNVNQAAIKKLPNTEVAKRESITSNIIKILLVFDIFIMTGITAYFICIFRYKKVNYGQKRQQ